MVAQIVPRSDIWEAFTEALREAGYRPHSVATYLRLARVYARRTGGPRINPLLIRDYLAARTDLSPHSQNCTHYALVTFWLWQQRGVVDRAHGPGAFGRAQRLPPPHPYVRMPPTPVVDPLPALRAASTQADTPARTFAVARALAFAELLRLARAKVSDLMSATVGNLRVRADGVDFLWDGEELLLDDDAAMALRRWLGALMARRKRPLRAMDTLWGSYQWPARCVSRQAISAAAGYRLLAVRRTYREAKRG